MSAQGGICQPSAVNYLPMFYQRHLYPGSTINKGQLVALLLAYLCHGVSGKGLKDLLDLLNIVPGCVPHSKHFLKE